MKLVSHDARQSQPDPVRPAGTGGPTHRTDGVGANLLNTQGFTAGPIANLDFGRHESGNRRFLAGLGNIDPTLQAGGFVQYELEPYFSTKLEIIKGVASFGGKFNKSLAAIGIFEKSKGNSGLKAEWSATFNLLPVFNNRLIFSVGPSVTFFDKTYEQTAFGVTARQSIASGYKAFSPRAGFSEAGLNVGALYLLTDRAFISASASYSRLVGDAARSPIVRGSGGARDQVTAGAAIIYRFTR